MRITRLITALFGALLIAAPAAATPVCAEIPREACLGRIFPEAATSLSFIQHDSGEFLAGIEALEEEFPRYVKVRSFSEIFDKKTLSAGGREMYLLEVTDFKAPEKNKLPVVVSLSVHGLERAGLEGGVRYAEDLVRWATGEPDHELRNGTEDDSIGVPVAEALRKVHLYLANINPDGWAAGDLANGAVFTRGNANDTDLNRQFPTMGWTDPDRVPPLTEPEAVAWVKYVERIDPVVTADLHGELTSANNAFADIMYPAGQWNPKRQAQHEALARHMSSNITRYFEEQAIELAALDLAGISPAEYATGYDVVGYDDSGFMGDYFSQNGAVDVDVEHFMSHYVPNSAWIFELEKAHIAAVRGEIETLVVEALATRGVKARLDFGRTGYLFDPKVVGASSTRMTYFKHLGRFAERPLKKLWADRALSGGLRKLDSLVIAGDFRPESRKGKPVAAKRLARALKRWVKAGGNLVLTDGAMKLLGRLGVVAGSDVNEAIYEAGHIDIEDFDDTYTEGVHSTASQTYYEVPLGYSVAEDSSPHWTVARAAWEEAGGVSVANIEDENRIGLGRMKLGKGTIGIFGAVLPPATDDFHRLYGVADYAVTVAGGQILNNMLSLGH